MTQQAPNILTDDVPVGEGDDDLAAGKARLEVSRHSLQSQHRVRLYQRNYKREAQIEKSNSLLSINLHNSQAHPPFHPYKNVPHEYV